VPLSSLCAVLLAALCHAAWNLQAKRAAASRHFVWLYSAASLAVWTPLVIVVLLRQRPHFGTPQLAALAGTSVLHLLYSLSLQAGYRAADLSIVYPLARGSGPLFAFAGAVLLFGERPGPRFPAWRGARSPAPASRPTRSTTAGRSRRSPSRRS